MSIGLPLSELKQARLGEVKSVSHDNVNRFLHRKAYTACTNEFLSVGDSVDESAYGVCRSFLAGQASSQYHRATRQVCNIEQFAALSSYKTNQSSMRNIYF
ncbi:MAG: hypothetical protein ACXWT0_09590 [Methylobacter sp.]